MIEIIDVTKARLERETPKLLPQRLQWTASLKPINGKITTLINNSSLSRPLPDQKGVTSVVPVERRDIE